MKPSNPACYECPKGKHGLHTWQRIEGTGIARCIKCSLKLTEEHTAEVFYDYDAKDDGE